MGGGGGRRCAGRVIHANAIIIIQFASPRLREPDRGGGGGDDVNLCVLGARSSTHRAICVCVRSLAGAQIGNRTQKLRRRQERKRIRLSDEQNEFENAARDSMNEKRVGGRRDHLQYISIS